MKSAYELAMEKLNQEDPLDHKPLTENQKKQIEAIKAKYKAKIAERETFLGQELIKNESTGKIEEANQIRLQISREKQRLEEDQEMEINRFYKEQ